MKISRRQIKTLIREALGDEGFGTTLDADELRHIADQLDGSGAMSEDDALERVLNLLRQGKIEGEQGAGSNFIIDIQQYILQNPGLSDDEIVADYVEYKIPEAP